MNTSTPKQFLPLHGKPVLLHTVETFLSTFSDLQLIIVLPESHYQEGSTILEKNASTDRIKTVTGGTTRFHSVRNGLNLVEQNSIVFVHDAVRCLVTKDLVNRCFEAALENGNAIPAIPLADTVRIETENGSSVLDRTKLHIIQTPQTFFSNLLLRAFEQEYDDSFTDEATVAEKFGIKIHLIPGEEENIKLTRPIDMVIAENLLSRRTVVS